MDALRFIKIEPMISRLAEESYLDEATADVYFIFKKPGSTNDNNEQEVRIPAHKILLKFRSDVFGAMFYGELREKGDVQIVDATADGFKEFLKTFYFDEPDIEMIHIPEILQLIRKYSVEGCMSGCDGYLQAEITCDNVCWIYDLALEFQLPLTKSRCEQQISLKAAEIFQSSNFLERSYETVLQIVSLNNFNCGEYDIFKACIAWAKEECLRKGLDGTEQLNLRNQLQDILYQIRFRSMNSTHVGDVIKEYHRIFTQDELADLALLALSHSDPVTLISKGHRDHVWNTGILLSCSFIDYAESQMTELGRLQSVIFSSNQFFVLRQIQLGNLYNVDKVKVEKYESANLKLQIVEKSQDVDVIEDEIVHYTNHPTALIKFGSWFTLPKMILIQPMVKYEIRLEFLDKTGNKYLAHGREASDVAADIVVKNGGRDEIKISVKGKFTLISAIKLCNF